MVCLCIVVRVYICMYAILLKQSSQSLWSACVVTAAVRQLTVRVLAASVSLCGQLLWSVAVSPPVSGSDDAT